MNNKYINRAEINKDKNQIIEKNKNNMIENFHDINNRSNVKADTAVTKYGNFEAYDKNKNFNLKRNLNSNNQNAFQNNYNLNREKGSFPNSNIDSGFEKLERAGGNFCVKNLKLNFI